MLENRLKDDGMNKLTIEQKLWKGAGVIWYSQKPLLLYLCIPALLMCFGMLLFGGRDAQDVLAHSSHFYHAAGILLTMVILHKRSKKRGSSLGREAALECRDLAWKRLFLLAGMGFGCAVVFSALLSVLPFPAAWMEAYHNSSSQVLAGTDQVIAMFSAVFLAPVAEEIIFRGYMLGRLMCWFEARCAVMISSAVFALCHVSVLWMIYSCLLGIILGWISVREDNTVYSIALHIGFNLSILPIHWINERAGLKAVFFGSSARIVLVGLAAGILIWWTCREYRREEVGG